MLSVCTHVCIIIMAHASSADTRLHPSTSANSTRGGERPSLVVPLRPSPLHFRFQWKIHNLITKYNKCEVLGSVCAR